MTPKVPPEILLAAIDSKNATGCPASVTVAQWILESTWGKEIPLDSNNPFGIKAKPGQPFVEAHTNEWDQRQHRYVTILAKFAKFDSVEQAFEAHGKLLMDPHGPYANAVPYARDIYKFVSRIAPIYATDPNYDQKLIALIEQLDLQKLDRPASSFAEPPASLEIPSASSSLGGRDDIGAETIQEDFQPQSD